MSYIEKPSSELKEMIARALDGIHKKRQVFYEASKEAYIQDKTRSKWFRKGLSREEAEKRWHESYSYPPRFMAIGGASEYDLNKLKSLCELGEVVFVDEDAADLLKNPYTRWGLVDPESKNDHE